MGTKSTSSLEAQNLALCRVGPGHAEAALLLLPLLQGCACLDHPEQPVLGALRTGQLNRPAHLGRQTLMLPPFYRGEQTQAAEAITYEPETNVAGMCTPARSDPKAQAGNHVMFSVSREPCPRATTRWRHLFSPQPLPMGSPQAAARTHVLDRITTLRFPRARGTEDEGSGPRHTSQVQTSHAAASQKDLCSSPRPTVQNHSNPSQCPDP